MSDLPPHESEIEESLLASILLYPDDRERILKDLDTEHFYCSAHQIIFEKCLELSHNGKQIGVDTIFANLNDEQRKYVKASQLSRIIDKIPVAPDVDHYIRILKDRRVRRRIIELTNAIAKKCSSRNKDFNKIEEYLGQIKEEISSVKGKPQFEQHVLDVQKFAEMELPEKCVFLDPWITEQSIILISGWRGTGKTWLALAILNAISKGEKFGPWDIEISVPCGYLDGEMIAQDIQSRINRLKMTDSLKEPVYFYSDAYISNLGFPRANLLDEKWRTAMKQLLIDKGIKLWVVDNIASLAPGINENVKEDWDPVNEWLLQLRFSGIATILLHHTGKGGTQRGTSAREDNIDTSIILEHPPDYRTEDDCRFIMKFKKNRVASGDHFLLADLEFQYRDDEWIWENRKRKAKGEILKLLDEGFSQKDVADTLDVSKSHVSQTRKKAIKDDLMTEDNKLTASGIQEIFG